MERFSKYLMDVNEVMAELNKGRATAYSRIKAMNDELEAMGYKTERGRVPRAYFRERFGINRFMVEGGKKNVKTTKSSAQAGTGRKTATGNY